MNAGSKIDWHTIPRISRLKRSPQELERRWAELLGMIPSSTNLTTLSNREQGMLAGITLKMGLDLRDADLSRLQSIEHGNNVEYSRRRTVGVKRPLPSSSKSEYYEDCISYDSMTDSQGEEDKEVVVNDNHNSSVCDEKDAKVKISHPPLTFVTVASSSSSSRAALPDLQGVLLGTAGKGEGTFSGCSTLQEIGIENFNSAQFSVGLPSLLNSNSTLDRVEGLQHQTEMDETKSSANKLRIFEGIEKLQMNKK